MNKFILLGLFILLAGCSDNEDKQVQAALEEKNVLTDAPEKQEEASQTDSANPLPLSPDTPADMQTAEHSDYRALLNDLANHPSRGPYLSRNSYRHPVETLLFLGIKPSDTIVELWPGGGWYTSILLPFTREHGKLYLAHWPASSKQQYRKKILEAAREKIANDPSYAHATLTQLGRNHYEIAPAGSADVVLTFRNLHNWYIAGYMSEVFQAAYDALKPGGIFGVVEHRAPEGVDETYLKTSGYMTVSLSISEAQKIGFQLAAQTEINANPKDSKFHPKGVWSLPPSLRAGEVEKYKQIGESDRMTLLFVK